MHSNGYFKNKPLPVASANTQFCVFVEADGAAESLCGKIALYVHCATKHEILKSGWYAQTYSPHLAAKYRRVTHDTQDEGGILYLYLGDLYNVNETYTRKRSRDLIDKALASWAGDCGFESHRNRLLFIIITFISLFFFLYRGNWFLFINRVFILQ